jgi:hypothetical protein
MDIKGEDGQTITKAAVATGLNFFKAQQAKDAGKRVDMDVINKGNQMMATTIQN